MKFFLDENLSPAIAEALKNASYDVVSAYESGLSGKDDANIRSFCVVNARVLITLDADFGNILRYPPAPTPGVIWLRPSSYTNLAITSLLTRVLQLVTAQNITGCLVVADDKTIRIRRGIVS
jgi:predicted nuclease of predicted toxin-antitoxin system